MLRCYAILLLLILSLPVSAEQNTLGPAERAEGWRLLFDGVSLAGWRNYGSAGPVRAWAIEGSALSMQRDVSLLRYIVRSLNPFNKRPHLDLMTVEQFGNFELSIGWKISEGGNSGIFYLVPDDTASAPWQLGLEMQVLDNEGHYDGQIAKHRAGDLYDLVSSSSEPVRPAGEWNTARIRVEGNRVQHWLNGAMVVDIERSGPDWEAVLAASKFSGRPDYGQALRGHIVLQDHGDRVWYRNIKIRELL